MEREENVYGEIVQTGEIASAKEGSASGQTGKEAPTELGKFKDVDALLKAYGCLQAEFTRRSQRLKELEREAENRKANKNGGEAFAAKGAEKLRKKAEERREEAAAFDRFVAEIEGGESVLRPAEISENAQEEGLREAFVEDAFEKTGEAAAKPTQAGGKSLFGSVEKAPFGEAEKTGPSVAESREETAIPSRKLYELASKDEGVRLQIIGEYLASLKKAGAPLTLGGTGAPVAPPMRARTIDEAGNMALRWFKSEGVRRQ